MIANSGHQDETVLEVEADKTLVVAIDAKIKETAPSTSIELYLTASGDDPLDLPDVETLYLVGEGNAFAVPVLRTALELVGFVENIPEGTYEVRLRDPGRPSGIVQLEQTIYFDFDKHTLPSSAGGVLDAVVKTLMSREKDEFEWVECRGYTDSTGSSSYNEFLSLRRAAAVKSALVEKLTLAGIKRPNVVNATGRGELEGRDAKNRRVDFFVTWAAS